MAADDDIEFNPNGPVARITVRPSGNFDYNNDVGPKLPIQGFDYQYAADPVQALQEYTSQLPIELPKQVITPEIANQTARAGANLFTDVGSKPRFQTWPEVMVRSALTAPGDALSGDMPFMLGQSKQDYEDLAPEQNPILRAQDLAGMAGGASFGAVKSSPAVAMAESGRAGAPLAALEKVPVRNAPVFYSAVEHAVQNAPEKMGVNEWWNYLKEHQGVKQEELDWLGLNNILGEYKEAGKALPKRIDQDKLKEWKDNNKGQVPSKELIEAAVQEKKTNQEIMKQPKTETGPEITKQELEDYVKAHKVELKEVNKGVNNIDADTLVKLNKKAEEMLGRGETFYNMSYGQRKLALEDLGLSDSMLYENPPTKFSQWQLPGGENYREMLLTLPRNTKIKDRIAEIEKRFDKIQDEFDAIDKKLDSADLAKQRLNLYNEKTSLYQELNELHQQSITENPNFTKSMGSHWDEPNTLAHVRTNDRIIQDPTGNGGPLKTLNIEEIQSDWHQKGRKHGYKGEVEQLKSTFDAAEKKILDSNDEAVMGNPDLKDGLKMAIDKKIITADEAKAYQRYVDIGGDIGINSPVPDVPIKQTWPDLALKRMIRHAAENGYDAISWTPGEAQAARFDLSKHVKKIDWSPNESGETLIKVAPQSGSNISFTIDKQGNVKLTYQYQARQFEGKNLSDIVGKDVSDKILNKKDGSLEGLDLKMGGEGMKTFYDKMLVDKANAIAKKFGGKVETAYLDDFGNVKSEKGNNRQPVWLLKLPQSLKDTALQKGFSLFADSSKAGAPLSAMERVQLNPLDHDPFTMQTYHGTPFNTNKFSQFSTPDLKLAEDYAKGYHSRTANMEGANESVAPLKIDPRDYHVVDAKGKRFHEINPQAMFEATMAKKKGVIIHNVLDNPGGESKGPNTTVITLDPKTRKSAITNMLAAGGLPLPTNQTPTLQDLKDYAAKWPVKLPEQLIEKVYKEQGSNVKALATIKALSYAAWAARPSLGPGLWAIDSVAAGVLNASPMKERREGMPLAKYKLVPVKGNPFEKKQSSQ